MPSFSQRDLMLLLGLSLGIVVYYKFGKPFVDPIL